MANEETCPGSPELVEKPPFAYRYFNQPIEQIHNFQSDEPQLLCHNKGTAGLVWYTPPECITLAECLQVIDGEESDPKLRTTKQRVRTLQNFGGVLDDEQEGEGCDLVLSKISVVTCIRIEGNNLVIERKKVTVIAIEDDDDTSCTNIPLETCQQPPAE